MSGAQFPEGWVLLIILFGFPFLLARKNIFNAEKVIHEYMTDSEKHFITMLDYFSLWSSRVKAFYTCRMKLSYRLGKFWYNAYGKLRYILGNGLYMVHQRITQKK